MRNRVCVLSVVSGALFTITLAACGGGSDSTSHAVPATASSNLGSDEASAKSLVSFSVASDDLTVNSVAEYKNINSLTSTVGAAPSSVERSAPRATKQIQQTVGCDEYFSVGSLVGQTPITSCVGNITSSSNIDELQNNDENFWQTGLYFNINFDSVLVYAGQSSYPVGGSITMTVLNSVNDANGSGFQGAFRIAVNSITGFDDTGAAFGPVSETIDVTFDGQGNVSYVIDGVRVSEIQITQSDADNFVINSGSVITTYDDGHAEVEFQNWNVLDGVPQQGSSVTVTGANGTAVATVVSVEPTQVTFQVVITVDGISQTHQVIALITNGQLVVT